jgi:cobaltochelatase CobT
MNNNKLLREARVTLASLPILAQGLAGKHNVHVVFDPNATTARTNGKRITLPPIPLPTSGADVETAKALNDKAVGFIVHEVGHVRYTDFDAFSRGASQSQIHQSLLNAIEDPRQEMHKIRDFPGARGMLDRMCARLIGASGFYSELAAGDHPRWLLSAYTLYVLRGSLRGQPEFAELARKSRPAVIEVFGEGFVSRLEVLLATKGQNLYDTSDAVELTNSIVNALKQEQEKEQERQNAPDSTPPQDGDDDEGQDDASGQSGAGGDSDQDGDDDSGAGAGSGSCSDEDDAAGDGDQEADADADEDGSSDGSNSDADGDADAGSRQGGDDEDGKGGSSSPDDSDVGGNGAGKLQAIENALADDGAGQLRDLGDILDDAMKADAGEIRKHGFDGHVADTAETLDQLLGNSDGLRPHVHGQFDAAKALRCSGRLRSLIRNEMQALTLQREHESVRGSVLNQRTIHRTSSGDRRLFLHIDERKGLDTAVFILTDVSQSMAGPRMEHANQATYASAVAMGDLQGVSVGMGVFPYFRMGLKFGESARRMPERFALRPSGAYTPLAEGVLWASRLLARQPQQRKILLVITDGVPSNEPAAVTQLQAAEKLGIETMGIGIGLPHVRQLFERCEVINDLSELAPAMLKMLKGSLRSQLAA